MYDGGEFAAGDDVYVKRREGAESDADDPEEELCCACFRAGGGVMVECDVCLGGFHLRCVRPPLRRVPEGGWACPYCEAERAGRAIKRPKPPEGKRMTRTAKEKLLSSDLWAARIERSVRVRLWSGFRSPSGDQKFANWLISHFDSCEVLVVGHVAMNIGKFTEFEAEVALGISGGYWLLM